MNILAMKIQTLNRTQDYNSMYTLTKIKDGTATIIIVPELITIRTDDDKLAEKMYKLISAHVKRENKRMETH